MLPPTSLERESRGVENGGSSCSMLGSLLARRNTTKDNSANDIAGTDSTKQTAGQIGDGAMAKNQERVFFLVSIGFTEMMPGTVPAGQPKLHCDDSDGPNGTGWQPMQAL